MIGVFQACFSWSTLEMGKDFSSPGGSRLPSSKVWLWCGELLSWRRARGAQHPGRAKWFKATPKQIGKSFLVVYIYNLYKSMIYNRCCIVLFIIFTDIYLESTSDLELSHFSMLKTLEACHGWTFPEGTDPGIAVVRPKQMCTAVGWIAIRDGDQKNMI